MTDEAIGKIVLAIGLLAAFALLLYGASGPTFPFNPSTPVFNNPFSAGQVSTIDKPDGNDPFSNTHYASVHGCLDVTYWTCVEDNDGDSSYIVLNTTSDLNGSYLAVHMRNLTGGDVVGVQLTVWCRSVGQATMLDNVGLDGGVVFIVPACPLGDTFVPVVVALGSTLANPFPLATFNSVSTFMLVRNHRSNGGLNGAPDPNAGNGTVFVTYMELSVTQNTGPDATACAGNVFQVTGCQLARIGTTFLLAVQFVINAVVYIFAWVAVIASYIGNAIGVLVWLFAVPGMPFPAQLLLDGLIAGAFGILILGIARIVRGVGT